MERKFLEDLGLEKEAIERIMTENGKDVNVEKAKTTTAETKLVTANTNIQTLQETVKKFDGVDVEKLKTDLTALQTKYDTDTVQIKLENALDLALRDGKAKNPKLVKAALDISKIKLDGDKILGLTDQLDALKKSDAYLFEEEKKEDKPGKSPAKVDSGRPHQDPPGDSAPASLLGALKEKYEKGD